MIEVKWQVALSNDELAPMHDFTGRALSQRAEPKFDLANSSDGRVDPVASIEDFLSAWWNLSGGAHGTAHGWQMSAKRKGLSEYLRAYQTTNGQLPRGTFKFKYISLSTGQEIAETLDADVLHNKVASRAAGVRS